MVNNSNFLPPTHFHLSKENNCTYMILPDYHVIILNSRLAMSIYELFPYQIRK